MEIKLTADYTEEPGGNGFTGWINEIHGVVAHGETVEKMRSELIKMLQIKFHVERERLKNSKKDKDIELNFAISN